MTPTGCAHQDRSQGLFHVLHQFIELIRPITADTRSQLVALYV